MPGVVELIDRAVHLPPGPQLSALLAQLPWERVPNARLVEVLQAHSRQLAHAQAGLFAGMAEIARSTPVAGLPDDAVSRVGADAEWASHEIAAALTWTPTTADRELELSIVLVRRLPLVFAALEQGLIDRGKAAVFADHLDPGRGELTPAQIRRLCERFVPLASGWTARRLSRRLLASIQAIDPEYHRRRYRRGLRERGVVLHLNRDGTAALVGEGLPPDEAAAAAARLDRLAEAARRAGHPARLGQITADLYLGMLNGSFHGLSEAQILDRLLARPRPEDAAEETAAEETAVEDPASGEAAGVVEIDEVDTGVSAGTETTSTGTEQTPTDSAGAGSAGAGPAPPGTTPVGAAVDGWRDERVAVREGIDVRVGLATMLGCDQRPGEIPGLGPIHAALARVAVARQRRGAQWQFAIVDSHGYLLLAGSLRRRPRNNPAGTDPPDRVRGGVVELHLTLSELARFATDPHLTGDWAGIVAEIAQQWADRHRLWRELAKNPRARYARGALGRHVRVRDRTCIGPCCERSARRSQLDHTRDHAYGGYTVEGNIGPVCWRHHRDKDRGWTLIQPEPGHFVWISPLGRTYRTRGGPVRPDLPEPEPPPEGTDRREDPEADHGQPPDLRFRWRDGRNPQPPPPATPDDEEDPSC